MLTAENQKQKQIKEKWNRIMPTFRFAKQNIASLEANTVSNYNCKN